MYQLHHIIFVYSSVPVIIHEAEKVENLWLAVLIDQHPTKLLSHTSSLV